MARKTVETLAARRAELSAVVAAGRHGQPVDIPGLFMLALQAFVDGAVVRIPARLRYRLTGGAVTWHYDLYRAEHWLREQITRDLARVAEATGLPTYEGSPEA